MGASGSGGRGVRSGASLSALALWAAALLLTSPAGAQVAEAPFELGGGGHVLVPVTINGIKGKAILDNGVPFTTLDAGFAKRAGLKELATPGGLALRAVTGRRMVEEVTLDIGGATGKVEPALLDLTDVMAADGDGVLGIIGGEIFRRYAVEINFDKRKVLLHERADFVAPSDEHLVRAANNMNSGKLFVPIQIEGGKITSAMVDFGMPFAVLLAERSVPEGWAERPSLDAEVGTATTGETFRRKPSRLVTATSIKLGAHDLKDVPVMVSNVGFGPISFPAIIGVGLLSRFNITMDIATTRIWLEPGKSFDAPFAGRPVVGVSWASPAKAGALRVAGVMAGSAAQEAGLKANDVVTKLNGQSATLEAFAALKDGEAATVTLKSGKQLKLALRYVY